MLAADAVSQDGRGGAGREGAARGRHGGGRRGRGGAAVLAAPWLGSGREREEERKEERAHT